MKWRQHRARENSDYLYWVVIQEVGFLLWGEIPRPGVLIWKGMGILYGYMCMLIHIKMAMYFRWPYFLPCWSFVFFGIWQNVWGRARAWERNKSNRKAEQERKFADYIHAHVMRFQLCVACWQGEECENERISYQKCRVYIGTMSRGQHQTHHLFCAGQNQRRGRSWSHKTIGYRN